MDDVEAMEEIRRRLLDRSFLYTYPESYSAGVVVALEAIERITAPPVVRATFPAAP